MTVDINDMKLAASWNAMARHARVNETDER